MILTSPYSALQARRWGLEVRPYEIGDVAAFEPGPAFAAERAHGVVVPAAGRRWTLTRHGVVRAIGGMEPIAAGTLGGWGYAADLGAKEWWLVARYLRMLAKLLTERGEHVLARAAVGKPAAMLEAAGFVWTAGDTFIWRP